MGNNTKYSELNNLSASINAKIGDMYFTLFKVKGGYSFLLSGKSGKPEFDAWLADTCVENLPYGEMFNYLAGILQGLKLIK